MRVAEGKFSMRSTSSASTAQSEIKEQFRGDRGCFANLPQSNILEQDSSQFLDIFLIFGCLALVASIAAALGAIGLPFGFRRLSDR